MLQRGERKLKQLWLTSGQERRKKMLHKVVRIVALNSKGLRIRAEELNEIVFNKDGSMSRLPSKILHEMMAEVDKGGGIFIEEVWAT